MVGCMLLSVNRSLHSTGNIGGGSGPCNCKPYGCTWLSVGRYTRIGLREWATKSLSRACLAICHFRCDSMRPSTEAYLHTIQIHWQGTTVKYQSTTDELNPNMDQAHVASIPYFINCMIGYMQWRYCCHHVHVGMSRTWRRFPNTE